MKTEMSDTLHGLQSLVEDAMKAQSRDKCDLLQEALTLIGTSKGTILNI